MDNLKQDIIFNTIDNGILILDENLSVKAWNRWLEIHTHMRWDDVINKNLCELFPNINERILRRKIKTALITNSASFYSTDPHQYLIKIKLSNVIDTVYDAMQQNVTLAPYKVEEKLVALYIYDKTTFCETNAKLAALNKKLKELSYRDPMTNSYNRRYFYEASTKMLSLSIRDKIEATIIILDIDNFKIINDTHGHAVGDDVIIALAQLLEKYVRQSDIVARFGGEEFVIFLHNSNLKNGEIIANKIKNDVARLEIAINEQEKLNFTASFGVASFDNTLDSGNIEHTISRADQCLYVAKESGRNRVITQEFLGAAIFNKTLKRKESKKIDEPLYII
ncbi:MAG: diguanylate cyclase [Candidatus Marinarcus sp.]|uniref:GGDEF domain-containing protein n=1 Tax=Candidatus Marinarcus sp. TaxID=3100987 RepID=UPI003B00DF65